MPRLRGALWAGREAAPVDAAVGSGLQLRLFGKPDIDGTRRLGVALAVADSIEEAVERAKAAAAAVVIRG